MVLRNAAEGEEGQGQHLRHAGLTWRTGIAGSSLEVFPRQTLLPSSCRTHITRENILLNFLFPICLEDSGIFLFAWFLLLFPSEMIHKCYIISPYTDCFP